MLKKFANFSLKLIVLYVFSVVAVGAALITFAMIVSKGDIDQKKPSITFKHTEFFLDIADTEVEREQGLSGRATMEDPSAMLFVFDVPGQYCFWMKDMKFSIDMVWLDSNKRVVHIQKNATPESYPDQFCPNKSAKYVLEFTAGTAEGLKLRAGDQALLSL